MRKIDLIRHLMEFTDDLEKEILVRVVTRDEHGVVETEQTVRIDSVVSFFDICPCINVTKGNFSEERAI